MTTDRDFVAEAHINDAYHEILCREILNPLNSAVRTEFQALIKRLRLELDGREDETSAASRREAIQRHEQACRTRERAQSELTERLRSMIPEWANLTTELIQWQPDGPLTEIKRARQALDDKECELTSHILDKDNQCERCGAIFRSILERNLAVHGRGVYVVGTR